MVLRSVNICLALSGARHDLGIRGKAVVREMSMSYQASKLLVENVRDLSVRLLMLNYLYNIKCQDATIETQHQLCPFKPTDLFKAKTLDSREWELLVTPGTPQALPWLCLEQQ